MIITLLCEPRSGSTSLANWFFNNRDEINSNWNMGVEDYT